jgi:hypothetical protein
MVARLTRLTQKIAILLHLVAENCTTCCSGSQWWVQELSDMPSYSTSLPSAASLSQKLVLKYTEEEVTLCITVMYIIFPAKVLNKASRSYLAAILYTVRSFWENVCSVLSEKIQADGQIRMISPLWVQFTILCKEHTTFSSFILLWKNLPLSMAP